MDSIRHFVFGKTPEEMVRHWKQSVRAQERQLEREIRSLNTEDAKARTQIKVLAKQGDVKGARLLAKELVRVRKHRNQMHTSKAQLSSIHMQLQHQLALLKVSGTLKKSTDIMKAVNRLMRLPVISKQVQEMAMEMTKAGVIEEMMNDTMEVLDDEELTEAADEQVEQVLQEIIQGKLGQLAPTPATTIELADHSTAILMEQDAMHARLEALRE